MCIQKTIYVYILYEYNMYIYNKTYSRETGNI